MMVKIVCQFKKFITTKYNAVFCSTFLRRVSSEKGVCDMRRSSSSFWTVLLAVLLLPVLARAQTVPLSDLDALRYITSYPDLIQAFGADPAKGRSHYEQSGLKEGRKISFDPNRYMASYPDLILALGGSEERATRHYIEWGFKEGRQSSFDALAYVASYGDLIGAFGTDVFKATRHYVEWGYKEGRRVTFDPLAYIASYADLMAAFATDAVAGALHYIQTGFKEGRRVLFDAMAYLAKYADLQAVFGTNTLEATKHYINWGYKEGRRATTISTTANINVGVIEPLPADPNSGSGQSFRITPKFGYEIGTVTGCDGVLRGNVYTTGPVAANCTVNVSYLPVSCGPPDPAAKAGSTFDATKLSWTPGGTIDGTSGNDHFTQRPLNLDKGGFLSFNGGAGNDVIEGDGWSGAVYWNDPKGVVVRLDQGCASDGHGGRDTLIDIRGVNGGGNDDILFGDERNNYFWTGGGSKNYVNGGGGDDYVRLQMNPATTVFKKTGPTSWEVRGAPSSAPNAIETVFMDNVEYVQYYDKEAFSSFFTLSGNQPEEVKFGMPIRLSTAKNSTSTEYFSVENFGFHVETINEKRGQYYYPTPANSYPAGSFSVSMNDSLTGDFNGDGLEDLFVVWTVFTHMLAHNTPTIPAIYLNRGDGTLGPANEIIRGPMTVLHMPYRSFAADFNRDGADDIIFSGGVPKPSNSERLAGVTYTSTPEPLVLLLSQPGGRMIDATRQIEGQEDGAALKGRVSAFSHDISAGDLDGDGDSDVFSGGALLINDGKGNFSDRSSMLPANARRTDTFVMSSAIGDLDGDGVEDLVAAYAEGYPRYAFLSGGQKIFGARTVALPEGTYGRAGTKSNFTTIIDINRDGRKDIVIAETRVDPYYVGRHLQILVNYGDGQFIDETKARIDNNKFDLASGEGQIYVRDINGDGILDIVHGTEPQPALGGDVVSGGLNIFLNDGAGKFRLVDSSAYPVINAADIDGQGQRFLVSKGFPARAVPIKLSRSAGIDFVSNVKIGWVQPEHPWPTQVALFVMRSRKPLN